MPTIYPQETLRALREKIEIKPILEAINYRLDTIQEIGETVKCYCPIHREAVFRTLIIDKRARRYRCSYSLCPGHKGGDLVDLYAQASKIDYDEAVQQLVERLKISIELPPAEDYIQKTLEVSENYLTLRAYDDAFAGFTKVLSVEPNNSAALKGLLEIHRARNEEEQRLEVLGRLATVTLQQEQFAEAADYCREILEKRPDDADVRLNYVECLIGQNETHRALEEYMRLADSFERRQEFDRALEVYRKIEQLNLDIIDVYPHIIQIMVASDRTHDAVEETLRKAADHESKGEYDRALESYRYVLEIDDSRADVREKLIDTAIVAGLDEEQIEQCLALVEDYVAEEAYANARRALEKLRHGAPGHVAVMAKYVEVLRYESRDSAAAEALLELAGRLIEEGRTQEAAAQLRSVGSTVDLSLDHLTQLAAAQHRCGLATQAVDTYTAIAERLAAENRLEEAGDVYETIIELDPTEPSHRQQQIDLYVRCGRNDRAREKCGALVELAIAKHRWDDANAAVASALEIAPDDPQLLEYQARILGEAGQLAGAQERLMALAQKYVATEQWDAARRALERVLAAEPNCHEAALSLADIAIHQGDTRAAREHLQRVGPHLLSRKDYAGAESALRKLHELAPDDPLVLVQLATAYGNLGEESQLLETYRKLVTAYLAKEAYPRAMEYCTAILDRDPENIWALDQMIKVCEKTDKTRSISELCLRLARAYEKLDDLDHVQEYFERALEIDPTDTQARTDYVDFLVGLRRYEAASNQAQIAIGRLSEQHNFREAIQIVEKLLEHTPDDIDLRRSLIDLCRQAGLEREFVTQCTQLINLYYRRNEFAEVADLYRELLEREPENVTFRTHLIDALMRLKRRDEAVQQYFELAGYYRKNENHEDAEGTLIELLDQSPGNPRALEMLIDVLIDGGRHEQAVQRIGELSEIYVGVGKNDKAVETLRRVLAFDPDNRDIRRRIADIAREDQHLRVSVDEQCARADAYWEEGNTSAALQAQREAARLRPDDTGVRRRLAEMLTQQGNTSAALEELIEVARSQMEQARYEEAVKTVDEILADEPNNYAARRLRAELFAKMGNQRRALEEFMRMTPSGATPFPGDLRRAGTPTIPPEPLQVVAEFTFDNFVVGDRNRFAHATALAVAKAPAIHYNPLFLYSDVGLGKTHLISAIANYTAEHQGELRVLYTNAEEFASQLVEAIQNNTVNAFRSRYKAANVLLVDDIQFLAGKERAQEEFFHIFNTLFQAKRQIVVTSDRLPKEIARLEKRLKSRFGSGVIVDIQAPDLETRTAILKKELERRGDVQLDDQLVNLIAERIDSNVRELKGVLNQVLVKHQLSGAEINEALVREVLDVYAEEG